MHGPIGDSWPMALLGADLFFSAFSPTARFRGEVSIAEVRLIREGIGFIRRLACQIVGVETYLLFPDDQRDRGNFSRQSQACHRGLPSLGEQIFVEIA